MAELGDGWYISREGNFVLGDEPEPFPWCEDAVAAAIFASKCHHHRHRGVINCGDKVVIYGTRTEAELLPLLDRIKALEYKTSSARLDHSWAIVVYCYEFQPVPPDLIEDFEAMLWEVWTEVSGSTDWLQRGIAQS